MKYKYFFLLLFFASNSALSQNPEIDSTGKYHYTICIYRKSTIDSKILINEKMDSVTANDSRIFGRVNLTDKNVLPYSFVKVNSANQPNKESSITDSLGNFSFILKPDTYDISFSTSGHDPIKVYGVIFAPGDVRRISVVFGDLSGFYTYGYITKKPQSKNKLKRVEKKLAKELELSKSKQFAKPQL